MSSEFTLSGAVVSLPVAPLDDHVGVVEVLIQEGFRRFALPAVSEDLAGVIGIFGSRADFGVSRVTAADQAATVVAAGARFALADLPEAAVAEAFASSGIPCYGSAMTPTEVRAVLRLPFTGVLIYPADVVGHAFAQRLAELSLVTRCVPMGGLGAYAMGEWFKVGAPAACLDATLLGDAYQAGSLSALRDRTGAFIAAEQKLQVG